jgi:hypothetical protein
LAAENTALEFKTRLEFIWKLGSGCGQKFNYMGNCFFKAGISIPARFCAQKISISAKENKKKA